MAIVTKKYLYETIAALLAGGNPSVGKKFEPRMVQAHLQSVINRKLKMEYMSATLPSDETIPEGLVLACYDDIPVEKYKNLSRAKLPAMPVSLRRNMGVYFVGPAQDPGGQSGSGGDDGKTYLIIESVIKSVVNVIGTDAVITGLDEGSVVITCDAFADKYLRIVRGNFPTPGIDPEDGSNYFTKSFGANFFMLSSPLSEGEYLKIEGFLPIVPDVPTFIIIESIVDMNVVTSGIPAVVTGIEGGSSSVTCSAFMGKNLDVKRGLVQLPSIDPGDGSGYFTKVINADTFYLSTPLTAGEYLKIETL